jgi:hypothetical protein
MTSPKKSAQSGVLNDETTAPPQDLPSTNAVNPSMLVTSGTTAPTSHNSPDTPNSPAVAAKMIQAFAAKLGALVEWRRVRLPSGRSGFVLFFDVSKWEVDPVSKALRPK